MNSSDFSFLRFDILLTASQRKGTAILLNSNKTKKQKLLVGDDSGTVQCLSLKRDRSSPLSIPPAQEVQFKVSASRRECSALCAAPKERLYTAFGQSIQCLNRKKGTHLGSYTTILNEEIHYLSLEPVFQQFLFAASSFSLNSYEISKNLEKVSEAQHYQSSSKINAFVLYPVRNTPGNSLSGNGYLAVLGCQDRVIRIIENSSVLMETRVDGPVSVLHYSHSLQVSGNLTKILLYGTENGHLGAFFLDSSGFRPLFYLKNQNYEKSGISCICTGEVQGIPGDCIILARDDGLIEFYRFSDFLAGEFSQGSGGVEGGEILPFFTRGFGESIVSMSFGCLFSPEISQDLLLGFYSGKISVFSIELKNPFQAATGGNFTAPPLEKEKSIGSSFLASLKGKSSAPQASGSSGNSSAASSGPSEFSLSSDDGDRAISGLKQEIEKLKEKIEKEKQKVSKVQQASGGGGDGKSNISSAASVDSNNPLNAANNGNFSILTGGKLEILPNLISSDGLGNRLKSSFTYLSDHSQYKLTLESPFPLDCVLFQWNCAISLVETDFQAPSIIESWQFGENHKEILSKEKKPLMTKKEQGNSAFACGKNEILAIYRFTDPKESFSRLEIRFRPQEGQKSLLSICCVPRLSPKTAFSLEIPIKPLCLHELWENSSSSEKVFSSRPMNSLQLTGEFSFNQIHSWMADCFHEFPTKIPKASETLKFFFRSSYVNSFLAVEYSKGNLMIRAENPSSLVILKEFLTREALNQRVSVSPLVNFNPDSVFQILSLLRPRLEELFAHQQKIQWIFPLKELSLQESSERLKEILPEDFKEILEGGESLEKLHNDRMSKDFFYLKNLLKELFLDARTLQGNFSGNKQFLGRLEEILHNFQFQQLRQIYQDGITGGQGGNKKIKDKIEDNEESRS